MFYNKIHRPWRISFTRKIFLFYGRPGTLPKLKTASWRYRYLIAESCFKSTLSCWISERIIFCFLKRFKNILTKNLGKKFVFHIMDVWTGPKFCPSRSVRVGCDIQTDLTLVLSGSPGWFLGPEFHVRCSNKVQTVLVLNTGFGNLWSQKKYFFKFSELGIEDTSSFIWRHAIWFIDYEESGFGAERWRKDQLLIGWKSPQLNLGKTRRLSDCWGHFP